MFRPRAERVRLTGRRRKCRAFRFGPDPNAGWTSGLRVSHIVGIVVAGVIVLALTRLKPPLSIGLVESTSRSRSWRSGQVRRPASLEWVPVADGSDQLLDGQMCSLASPGWGGWSSSRGADDRPQAVETVISLPGELSDLVVLESRSTRTAGS